MSDGWVAGGFNVQLQDLESGEWRDAEIAGWIKGHFALDFQVFEMEFPPQYAPEYAPCWVVTHIPTGHNITKLAMPLGEVKEAVAFIANLADWSFTSPESAKSLSHIPKAIKDKYGDEVAKGIPVFSPMFVRA